VLATAAPIGTPLPMKNRDLAEQIGYQSASPIPAILRKLEALGYIERITTARGSLIVVLHRSDMPDRWFEASQSDLYMPDRSIEAQSANPIETPDRSPAAPAATADRSGERSAPTPPTPPQQDAADSAATQDRVETACMDDHDKHDQQQQHAAHTRELTIGSPEQTDQGRPKQVWPAPWRKILAKNPGYTAADFERELALVRARPGVLDEEDAVQVVVGVRKRGEVIYARQEATDDGRQASPNRPQRPADAAQRAGKPRRHDRRNGGGQRAAGPGANAGVDYTALLAEIQAAGPLDCDLSL
jgi:hypothetical protein